MKKADFDTCSHQMILRYEINLGVGSEIKCSVVTPPPEMFCCCRKSPFWNWFWEAPSPFHVLIASVLLALAKLDLNHKVYHKMKAHDPTWRSIWFYYSRFHSRCGHAVLFSQWPLQQVVVSAVNRRLPQRNYLRQPNLWRSKATVCILLAFFFILRFCSGIVI